MTGLVLLVLLGLVGVGVAGGKKKKKAPGREPPPDLGGPPPLLSPEQAKQTGLDMLDDAIDLCPAAQPQILAAGEAFAVELPVNPTRALATLVSTLHTVCPELIAAEEEEPEGEPPPPDMGGTPPPGEGEAGIYYRTPAPGMDPALYSRYEQCMIGMCDVATVHALADELEAAGFSDHANDLDELEADMLGGTVGPEATGPEAAAAKYGVGATAAELAAEVKRQAAQVGCVNVPLDLIAGFQGAAKREGAPNVEVNGMWDFLTAAAAAMFVPLPPPPCRFPEPPNAPAGAEAAADEFTGIFGDLLSSTSPGWPQQGG